MAYANDGLRFLLELAALHLGLTFVLGQRPRKPVA
jgi:hypothetical protein